MTKFRKLAALHLIIRLYLAGFAFSAAALNGATRDYAIEISAQTQISPPSITLNWRADGDGRDYQIFRKRRDGSTWNHLSTLPSGSTSFTDPNVGRGEAYEYRVTKKPLTNFGGSGYIYAGIDLPMQDQRGALLLVIDNTYADDLSSELHQFQKDLVGDGWKVVRLNVNRSDSPASVKAKIVAEYLKDPAQVRSVLLFGHVPVPYSGDFYPDYHPEHKGAWPADPYYGDMDGVWTDLKVSNSGAERQQNKNVPGDGKFDQTVIPSAVELQVGRVDLHDLPGFAPKTEKDLLRQYLNKNHRFRHRLFTLPERALISDNFGESQGEAFASSGWRNFAPFFGSENIKEVTGWNYFSTLASEGYLWSYACGGGSYNYCHYVGGTGDFGVHDTKSAFVMLLGSYFGDWDSSNNFLRAPLATPTYGLASVWSGRPHWFLHHMALGENIGFSAKLTQNNKVGGLYHPAKWEENRVHIALMGDPTLRMHPVIPPPQVTATTSPTGVTVAWTASTDNTIRGYHVYRGDGELGPFTRLTTNPVTTLAFSDSAGHAGQIYMVRAVKLQTSASGTYFNPSQGVFATAQEGEQPFIQPKGRIIDGSFVMTFPVSIGELYVIESSADLKSWEVVRTEVATSALLQLTDGELTSGGVRFYRALRIP